MRNERVANFRIFRARNQKPAFTLRDVRTRAKDFSSPRFRKEKLFNPRLENFEREEKKKY